MQNFTLQNHWNGIIGLATEIVAKKISSEEVKAVACVLCS